MSLRENSFVSGEYYHIYNRGNSKQKIFHDNEDYKRFVSLLHACNQKNNFKSDNLQPKQNPLGIEINLEDRIVGIGSYCLMPNHFHILITEIIEGGVSKFMQKVTTAYVMYYNKKYKRTGGLFEGKFKSKHLYSDKYIKYIFAYIHLNPIKILEPEWKTKGIKNKRGALQYLREYNYSSFIDFQGKDRHEKKILSKTLFPKYFPNKDDFEKEIIEWMNYDTPPIGLA